MEIFKQPGTVIILNIDSRRTEKTGRSVTRHEYDMLRIVNDQMKDIPSPIPFEYFEGKICMSYVEGETLNQASESLSLDEREWIASQIV